MITMQVRESIVAKARCRLYKFLSAMLAYPNPDTLSGLAYDKPWVNLQAAQVNMPEQCGALSKAMQHVRASVQGKALEALEADYVAIFGSSPRGRIAPYECEYGNKEIFQFSSELADISAFYSVFGLNACGPGQERADHIAVECEFMAFLCAREIIAEDDVNAERLELIRDAQRKFMEEHLARWATAFAHQLGVADRDGLYGALAKILSGLIANDCARMNVQRGAAFLPLREVPVADDPENCMSCGKEEGLPGADHAH